MVRNRVRFSATPTRHERAAPISGEHSREVLTQLLGIQEYGLNALRDDGVMEVAADSDDE